MEAPAAQRREALHVQFLREVAPHGGGRLALTDGAPSSGDASAAEAPRTRRRRMWTKPWRPTTGQTLGEMNRSIRSRFYRSMFDPPGAPEAPGTDPARNIAQVAQHISPGDPILRPIRWHFVFSGSAGKM